MFTPEIEAEKTRLIYADVTFRQQVQAHIKAAFKVWFDRLPEAVQAIAWKQYETEDTHLVDGDFDITYSEGVVVDCLHPIEAEGELQKVLMELRDLLFEVEEMLLYVWRGNCVITVNRTLHIEYTKYEW